MSDSKTFLVAQEYRIYPNRIQKEQINKTLGCCDIVDTNIWFLDDFIEIFFNTKN